MAIDKKKSPYKASITREQFLFYEMRTTAKLLDEGLDDKEVVQRIIDENLFQYPTEKSVEQQAKAELAGTYGREFDEEMFDRAVEETDELLESQVAARAEEIEFEEDIDEIRR